MRVLVLLGVLLGVLSACASPAVCPSMPQTAASSSSASPAVVAARAPACRKRGADQARILDELVDSLRQPEAGAYRKEHAELFRFMPTLHERGVLSSIAPTFARDGENPMFAVTILVRNAQGGMDANLGFAAMPCPEGDLALVGPLIPLGTAAGVIHWARRVPIAGASLTELEVEVSDAPVAGIGQRQPAPHTRSIVVGPKTGERIAVLGAVESLDDELPPQDGIRRSEARLFGSGWYSHRGGASYLWVHRVEYDADDLCRLKKTQRPASPPALRLLAHIDPKTGFTKDAVGNGFVIALGENQPPDAVTSDKEFTYRWGPTSTTDRYADQGPPATVLYGIFESEEAAKARAAAAKLIKPNIYATSATIPVKASAKTLRLGCMDYM